MLNIYKYTKITKKSRTFYSKGEIIHWLLNFNPLLNGIKGVPVPDELFTLPSK